MEQVVDVALGIDIGGTFTDVVLADADGIAAVAKLLTTPDEPARAAVQGRLTRSHAPESTRAA